jgi:GntR family transcriptional regulator
MNHEANPARGLQQESVEKRSPVPLYFQIERILQNRIQDRVWQPGAQIPTETELCEHFQVSRSVIRQALQNLTNRGLIERTPGKGTFVSKPKIGASLIRKLAGFHEDTLAQGHTPTSQVLHKGISEASPAVADSLNIEPGDPVLELHRLRFVDLEPHLLSETYLRLDIEPRLAEVSFTDVSLYAVLEERFDLAIASGRRTVEATTADRETARLLEITEGAPLLLLKSVTFLSNGRPMEYSIGKHRADRARFEVELIRGGATTIEGQLAGMHAPGSHQYPREEP